MSVTMKDVALRAGVNPSTVSRVLSGKASISEEVKAKVWQAVTDLGYRPNYTARALATSSTDTIGVVIDREPRQSLNNAYFINVLMAIASSLADNNREMLLMFSGADDSELNKVKAIVDSQRVDGIILLSVKEEDPLLSYLQGRKLPTVVIGNPSNKTNIACVDNDNKLTMYRIVRYLLAKGHHRLAFLGGEAKLKVNQDRFGGFKRALCQSGLAIDPKSIYQLGDRSDDLNDQLEAIARENYDAIVCTDDIWALQMLQKVKQEGIATEVTGFNNTPDSRLPQQEILTVDIRIDALGREAVSLLLDLISGKITQEFRIVDAKIIKAQRDRI